jgi:hypothetical protein
MMVTGHKPQIVAMAWFFFAGLLTPHQDALGQPSAPSTGSDATRAAICPTAEELATKWFKPLGKIPTEMRPSQGPMPPDCAGQLFTVSPASTQRVRPWTCTQFQWTAPELAYQPPYFDDVPLERYGQSVCPPLQPLLSAVHFFAMFPLMPYKLGLDGPYERVYTLGYYRPGSCDTPCVCQTLPWDFHAALLEAGAWTGGALLLP